MFNSRRDFIRAVTASTAGAAALMGGLGVDPVAAAEIMFGDGPVVETAQGGILECRASGDLVRTGKASRRSVGQAL